MIPVSLDFVIYFYFISTIALGTIFWFYWRTKDFANSDDFKYKGRKPIKVCELCNAQYLDNSNEAYSTCPKCGHLTPIDNKFKRE
jgi:hypothetical protein